MVEGDPTAPGAEGEPKYRFIQRGKMHWRPPGGLEFMSLSAELTDKEIVFHTTDGVIRYEMHGWRYGVSGENKGVIHVLFKNPGKGANFAFPPPELEKIFKCKIPRPTDISDILEGEQ